MSKDTLRIDDQPGSQAGHRVLTLTGGLVLPTVFDFQATVRADQSACLIIDFTTVPYTRMAGPMFPLVEDPWAETGPPQARIFGAK